MLKRFFTRKMTKIVVPCLLVMTAINAHADSNEAYNTVEEAFAIATLISDSDALTFGFANFDLDVDDPGFGTESSSSLKNSLKVFVVPYTWDLEPINEQFEQAITMRAFYISTERDSEIYEGIKDNLEQDTVGVYGSYSQFYHLDDNWYLTSELGLHLTYYENKYHYGDGVPESIINELEGRVFNVNAFAAIAEPIVGIGYSEDEEWGTWRVHNKTNYIYGHGLGGSIRHPDKMNPEGWRSTNGVELTVNVPELWGVHDFLTIDFKRIDLFGDLESMADDGYYYETSLGWVIDTNEKVPLLDNIGIGVSINYGSSISGATLVLYWNE